MSNPMQLSGSFAQSLLQRNLSQVRKPMGGVRAKPLFNDSAAAM